MRKKILMLIAPTLVALTAFAQPRPDLSGIDSLFRLLEQHNKFMGAAAMIENGEIIFHQAYGYADEAAKVKADAGTVYRIGSVTKTFTAVMVLQLVDEGKLRLNDKLEKYFPGLEGGQQITIEHLLRHRSGLYSLTSDSAYLNYYTQPQTRQEMFGRMMKHGLQFAPGEKMDYSNTNYILLGWLVEDLSGKTYAELLQQKIAKPLGLTHTFAMQAERGFAATSYQWEGDRWKPEPFTHMSVPGGAGHMYSTAEELLRFYHALFSGKLISAAALKQMTTLTDMFGMGLFAMPFYEHQGLGHTGGIDGFRTVAIYFPDEKVGVSVCSNALNYNQNEILIGMLSRYFGKPWQMPVIEHIDVDESLLDGYAGTYTAEGFPLKLTIRHRNGKLFGQGTGQPEFPLEARSGDTFVFENAGISITFKDGKLHLKQGAVKLEMSREE
ncbi:MAG TPA: serine hydrolase [Bacteroidales bacterium]|nr:serine hydrolase [Bacteroidales bacterium]